MLELYKEVNVIVVTYNQLCVVLLRSEQKTVITPTL